MQRVTVEALRLHTQWHHRLLSIRLVLATRTLHLLRYHRSQFSHLRQVHRTRRHLLVLMSHTSRPLQLSHCLQLRLPIATQLERRIIVAAASSNRVNLYKASWVAAS